MQKAITQLTKISVDQALMKAKSHAKKGKLEEAKELLEQVLDCYIDQNNVELGAELQAHNQFPQSAPEQLINKLIELYNGGYLNAVVDEARVLTKQYPNEFVIWNLLGAAAAQTGQLDRALDAYRKAVLLQPNSATAYNNLGNVLIYKCEYASAIEVFQKAIEIKPGYADAYNNIGSAFKEHGRLDDALEAYSKAVLLNPDYAEAHYHIGSVLNHLGKYSESIEAFYRALSLQPDYIQAYNNLGNSLKDQGRLDDALEAYSKAVLLNPDYAEAHDNMGRVYLLKEDFVKAFELMEWRWLKQQKTIGEPFKSRKPPWDGASSGEIFVWKEQGIGDAIVFSSMYSELNEKSSKLSVECDARLLPLFERSFSNSIKFLDNRNKISEHDYDCQLPSGSLPRYLRRNLEDFKESSSGWLKADPEKMRTLKAKLCSDGTEKIYGISWFTKSVQARAKQRNVPLELLANYLAKMPGKYVNLQYGDTACELSRLKRQTGIQIESVDEIDLYNDIDDLAALISICDVVISIDNLTAHLAGALGVDTRVLLSNIPDERWSFDGRESYWYDSVTLYRQRSFGDWRVPLDELLHDFSNIQS